MNPAAVQAFCSAMEHKSVQQQHQITSLIMTQQLPNINNPVNAQCTALRVESIKLHAPFCD